MKQLLYLAVALLLPGAVMAEAKLTVRADRESAIYQANEPIKFKIKLADDGKGLGNQKLTYDLSGDVAVNKKGELVTDANGEAELATALARPGFLKCTAKLASNPKVEGSGGAGIDPLKITPSRPKPADFDAFWDNRKKIIDNFPWQVKLTPVDSNNPKVKLYDLEVALPEGAPMRGYLAIPADAKAKSLPAYVSYHGAGVRSSGRPVGMAAQGVIALDINAHGILNGQPDAFYKDLETGALKSYRYDGCEDRDKSYFRGMFERVYQSLRYVKSRPEWDGKNLIVNGGSQGGGQALVAAGLDPAVTCCVALVPALCDHGGIANGRESGWPRFQWSSGGITPAKLAAADYIDAVNFVTRVNPDAEFYLSTGFIDLSCNPASVYAAYNTIPAKNKFIQNDVESAHPILRSTSDAANAVVRKYIEKAKSAKP